MRGMSTLIFRSFGTGSIRSHALPGSPELTVFLGDDAVREPGSVRVHAGLGTRAAAEQVQSDNAITVLNQELGGAQRPDLLRKQLAWAAR